MRISRDEQRRYIQDHSSFLHRLPPLREAATARRAALERTTDLQEYLAAHVCRDEDVAGPPAERRHHYLLRNLQAAASGRAIPRRVWAGLDSDDDGALEEEDEIEDYEAPRDTDGTAADAAFAAPDSTPAQGRKRKRGAAAAAEPGADDFAAAAAQAAQGYEDAAGPAVSAPEQLRDADQDAAADVAAFDAVDIPLPDSAEPPPAGSPRSGGSPPAPDADLPEFEPAPLDLDQGEQPPLDDTFPDQPLPEVEHSFDAFANVPQSEATQRLEAQMHERAMATLARIQELAQVLL